MTDMSPAHVVSLLGFLVGIVFGAVGNKTNFCTMGAVSDWVNLGNASFTNKKWFRFDDQP